jgi:hypothetical protein
VCTGVVAILFVVGTAFLDDWYDLYVARVAVRDFEATYGFRMGPVTVHSADGRRAYESWGIATVTVDGEFARLGVWDGDLPFAQHGHGATVLYEALVAASAGRASSFEVVNGRDGGFRTLRVIEVPPRKD